MACEAVYKAEYRSRNRLELREKAKKYYSERAQLLEFQEANRARVRAWAEVHPEEVRAGKARYYQRSKDAVKARSKAWLTQHPVIRKARYDTWRKANPLKVSAYSKKWRQANKAKATQSVRSWVERNPEKNALAQKRWALEHPEYYRRRYETLKNGDLTYEQWLSVLDQFNYCCAYCLRSALELTLDHIEPVSKGGRHTLCNVVPACKSCNSRKSNKPIWSMLNVKEMNHGTTH